MASSAKKKKKGFGHIFVDDFKRNYLLYLLVLPVLAHAAANASSVLLEQTGWLDGLYADLPLYFLTTAICLGAGALCWSRVRRIR